MTDREYIGKKINYIDINNNFHIGGTVSYINKHNIYIVDDNKKFIRTLKRYLIKIIIVV